MPLLGPSLVGILLNDASLLQCLVVYLDHLGKDTIFLQSSSARPAVSIPIVLVSKVMRRWAGMCW